MAYDGTPSPPALAATFRAVEATTAAQAEAVAAGLDRRPFDAALAALAQGVALAVAPVPPCGGVAADAVADWIAARLRRDIGGRVQAFVLMADFAAHAACAGVPPRSPHALSRRLAELGLRKKLSGGRTWYLDVALPAGVTP
jgi:hypothetical protein